MQEQVANPAAPALAVPSRRWIFAAFAAALALLTLTALLGYRQSQRSANSYDWVRHTFEVGEHASALDGQLLQMEAAHRAYLVQPAPGYLVTRGQRRAAADRELAALRRLIGLDPAQQGRLDEIEARLRARDARMTRTTAMVRAGELARARAEFDPDASGAIGPLREEVTALVEAENRQFRERFRAASAQASQLRWLLLFGPGLGVALLLIGVVSLFRELARGRRLARELAEAHDAAKRALDLVDASDDALIVFDAIDLRIVQVNRAACTQAGRTREELVGASVLAIKGDFDETQLRQRLSPLLAGVAPAQTFETRHRRRDGETVPVEVSWRLALTADGVPCVVSVARDIRARREAERERDLFFELSLDMLCIASEDGHFKRLSPAFATTLGWSVDELMARPFLDFVHPEDRAATEAEVARQIEAGQPVLHFENRYRHKDGGWRLLSWRSVPAPEGRMFATARDVTERHRAEQRILSLNEELVTRQRQLETANHELESFSYSVSHDLRAPLRHIDGYARMLSEDAGELLTPDLRRYLQTITDSARRMGQLIDDLLMLARLGRAQANWQRLDMNRLVADALAELGPTVATVAVADLPPAWGDAALLRQVWINLLSNAIKYSAPRGADARIEVEGEAVAGGARYRVRDNGVGFDMRYADKLFGVFQRLHSQDLFEGTGVGLAIVQRVLNRHGATIQARGEPDQGAEFSFELPDREDEP